jgi:plasmid maintenance system antidote protein VapI
MFFILITTIEVIIFFVNLYSGIFFDIMEMKTTTKVVTTLKELLKEKHITQRELANKLGCAYSLIGYYIRGEKRPTIDTFFEMCKILEVSPTQLAKNFGLDITGIPNDE